MSQLRILPTGTAGIVVQNWENFEDRYFFLKFLKINPVIMHLPYSTATIKPRIRFRFYRHVLCLTWFNCSFLLKFFFVSFIIIVGISYLSSYCILVKAFFISKIITPDYCWLYNFSFLCKIISSCVA